LGRRSNVEGGDWKEKEGRKEGGNERRLSPFLQAGGEDALTPLNLDVPFPSFHLIQNNTKYKVQDKKTQDKTVEIASVFQ